MGHYQYEAHFLYYKALQQLIMWKDTTKGSRYMYLIHPCSYSPYGCSMFPWLRIWEWTQLGIESDAMASREHWAVGTPPIVSFYGFTFPNPMCMLLWLSTILKPLAKPWSLPLPPPISNHNILRASYSPLGGPCMGDLTNLALPFA